MNATDDLLDLLAIRGEETRARAVDALRARFDDDGEWAPLTRLLDAGGKSIRPRLVTLGGCLAGLPGDGDVARAAAAVELMHVGSLYHDDVLDGADERRGVTAVHVEQGNTVAILLGDILFAVGSELIAEAGADAFRLFAQTLRQLCAGQMRETRATGDPRRTATAYYDAIHGKTAALIACAAELGGLLAGSGPTGRAALRAFGQHLGLAFQIRDDIVDLSADPTVTGKDAGRDLEAGVVTLPVILAVEADPALGARVEAALGGDEPPADVAAAVLAGGGGRRAADAAAAHVSQARARLDGLLPPGVDGGALVETFLPPVPAALGGPAA